jgi:nucleotide-binding universal stress UspA family protein
VTSALFAAAFVTLTLSAFHSPVPHGVPVGITAPATVTGQVEDGLGSQLQGGFDLRVYPSETAARTGIARHQVDGALIAADGHLRLLVAQAGGTGPAQALTQVFTAMAARSGQHLTVTDVVPPLPGDSDALSSFFVILGVLVPSLAAGSASALVFRRARPAWCVAAPVTAAAVMGVIAAGLADGVAGLGNFPAIAGTVALFSLAVAAPTAVLGRIRPPLTAVAVLVFLVLGLPVSGGPANLASFGPGFLRVFDAALPLGAAASAVRNITYFGGYDTAGHLWVLAAWALAGVAGLVLTAARRRQAPVRPALGRPALGRPALGRPALGRPALGRPALVPAAGAGPAVPALASSPALPPATLVVGFDNSGPARRALAWAAQLLAVRPGTLRIIYADHTIIGSDLSGAASAEMAAERENEAAGIAAAAAELLAGTHVNYEFDRRQGSPADAILSGASDLAATVPGSPTIVVGRSGHAAHHVLGSVPVRLIHHSPYPVLAIP